MNKIDIIINIFSYDEAVVEERKKIIIKERSTQNFLKKKKKKKNEKTKKKNKTKKQTNKQTNKRKSHKIETMYPTCMISPPTVDWPTCASEKSGAALLTLKAPSKICSRRHSFFFSRRFTWNVKTCFLWKNVVCWVVIGALRVKVVLSSFHKDLLYKGNNCCSNGQNFAPFCPF